PSDLAEVQEVEAGAAVLLRDHQALPALLGHLAPQVRAVALVVFFHLANEALRALVLEEITGCVLQQLLRFGQTQVHVSSLSGGGHPPYCVPRGVCFYYPRGSPRPRVAITLR